MPEDDAVAIADLVWNDLIDMEPGRAKNRAPLAARWGGDHVVDELINAGHLEADGRRLTRTKASQDAALLWEVLPEDGTSIGNQRAMGALGWRSARRYDDAKRVLLATNEITLGRGRGGSIRRLDVDDQVAALSVANTRAKTEPTPAVDGPSEQDPELPLPMQASSGPTTQPRSVSITQAALQSLLWSAANALRGPVDPGDFKAYVFPVMFFKWISDTWDWHHTRAIDDWGEELTDEIESDYQPFAIPDNCHWADVHNTAVNVGSKLNQTLQRIEQANPGLVGVFGDVNWGNKDRLPESALVALLDAFHGQPLDPDHVQGDMLGAAYEYLLREFAEASGKKAGEFFTPRHVVHLLVKILDPHPGETVVDPACGSGGMLVETANVVREAGGNPDELRLQGQEVNLTTSAIAKMNLYLHGLEDFDIKRGDTFREPKFLDRGKLGRFDVVIANPPFSLQNWGAAGWTNDPYGRVICAVPPAKNADYAWIQHMIASMKDDTGRVGVVMPHGVLFRGGKEGEIRQCLMEKDLLEAVIGLPPNLFYSTSIPVCLMIWRKIKQEDRRGKVLMIDASARFQPGKNRNTMSADDIYIIHNVYRFTGNDHDRAGTHARLVDFDEIKSNGFDLNIGRYLATERTAEVDVEAAMATYYAARDDLRAAERVLEVKLKAAGFDA